MPPTTSDNRFRVGAQYLARGLRLAREPDILPYFLAPLTLNVLIFGGLMWWSFSLLGEWINQVLAWVPEWLAWLEWILWPALILMLILIVFYTFTLAANLIASPFNGLLAEKVASKLRPQVSGDDSGLIEFIVSIPLSLLRELRKLAYFIPIAVLVWLISAFTPLAVVAPILWFLLTAWTLALEYCDYQADNDRVSFSSLKTRLRSQTRTSLGFGAIVAAGTMIPILNLMIMPTAVCGATILWVERFDQVPQ